MASVFPGGMENRENPNYRQTYPVNFGSEDLHGNIQRPVNYYRDALEFKEKEL